MDTSWQPLDFSGISDSPESTTGCGSSAASSDASFKSTESSLRNAERDIADMTADHVKAYAVQLSKRLRLVEAENSVLHDKLNRQEREFAKKISRRHQAMVTKQSNFIEKINAIQNKVETEKKIRAEFEGEVERMRKICRDAAERLRECLEEKQQADERCAELEESISKLKNDNETLQQLAHHFREQWECERHGSGGYS